MIEKIEAFLRGFVSSLQIARLYTTKHPRFNKFVDKAFESLQLVLAEREDLIIGIIGNEIAFEKEILFDLSRSIIPIITFLKDRGIEKIIFYRGIEKEELVKFIEFLILPKDEVKKDVQEYLVDSGVRGISIGKIKSAPLSSEELQAKVDYRQIFDDVSLQASESIEALLSLGKLENLNLRFSMENTLEKLVAKHEEILKLSTVKRYDFGTFIHSLNVCILAMYFSSKLGFSKIDCLDMGVASLFHDIGKLYISRRIIQKSEKLNEAEFDIMKNHSVLGAELLLSYAESIGPLPVVVCFEHHIKHDLSGYPKVKFSQPPFVASQIVSICDVYDSLSQRRNYKNDYSPDVIYRMMMNDQGSYFEPHLLERFFQIIGVWPIGSIVGLTDNRVAVVRGQNEDEIFFPKVEIILPKEQRELINLKDTKDRLKIERFLNPWKEGKDMLSLI